MRYFEIKNALYEARELTLNAFKSEILPSKPAQRKKFKIFTPKHILQRLPIALAQIKVANG